MKDSIILSVTSGVFLLAYKIYDSNKDMERHLHDTDLHLYYLLQFAILVLTFSFFFNGRYIIFEILKRIWNKFT